MFVSMFVFIGALVALVKVDVSLASALPHHLQASASNQFVKGLEGWCWGTHAGMIIPIQTLPNRTVGNHDAVVYHAGGRGADVW